MNHFILFGFLMSLTFVFQSTEAQLDLGVLCKLPPLPAGPGLELAHLAQVIVELLCCILQGLLGGVLGGVLGGGKCSLKCEDIHSKLLSVVPGDDVLSNVLQILAGLLCVLLGLGGGGIGG